MAQRRLPNKRVTPEITSFEFTEGIIRITERDRRRECSRRVFGDVDSETLALNTHTLLRVGRVSQRNDSHFH